jgi:GntR family transcriptional regulator
LLRRQQGRGTFVADHESDELATLFSNIRDADGQRVAGTLELLSQTSGPATRIEQQRLRLEADKRVVRTSRRRRGATGVFMREEACLAVTRFPGLGERDAGNYRLASLASSTAFTWVGRMRT